MHLTLNVAVTGFNPIQTLSAHVIKGTFLLVFYSLKMVIMANLDGHQGTTIPPPHLSIGVILSGNKRNRHNQKVVLHLSKGKSDLNLDWAQLLFQYYVLILLDYMIISVYGYSVTLL